MLSFCATMNYTQFAVIIFWVKRLPKSVSAEGEGKYFRANNSATRKRAIYV